MNMEEEIFLIKAILSDQQKLINDLKIAIKDSIGLTNKKIHYVNDVTQIVTNGYQQVNDSKINNNTNNIFINTETLEAVMEEVIPTQAMTTDELFETVDTILTEIIPSLMMDNE